MANRRRTRARRERAIALREQQDFGASGPAPDVSLSTQTALGVRKDFIGNIVPAMGANPDPSVEQSMAEQGLGPVEPFAPGRPINPYLGYGIEPRLRPFQTGYNIDIRPRHGRVSFDTMRALTSNWPVARMCIAHRINSFKSFTWTITPARGMTGDLSEAVNEGLRIMAMPDIDIHSTDPSVRSKGTPYSSFISKVLADLFRYDAPVLWKQRNWLGKVIALKVVDGSSIAPLLDYSGDVPEPPAPAYIQYQNGLPWEWQTANDLIYLPLNPQPDSPYGWAPIEDVLLPANTDIRMNMSLLEYYSEGSIPGGFINASPNITDPAKLVERQDDFEARLEGDQAKKQQVHYLMADEKYTQVNKQSFDENAYLWNFRLGCAAFGVVPQDLGITLDVNRASGDTQVDIQERISDRPLAMHLDGIFTRYLQFDRGLPVEFHTSLSAEREDRLEEARTWQVYVNSGAAGVDEMRSKLLGLPVDNERPVPRFIMSTRAGPIPLANLFQIAGPINPDTQAPAEQIPMTSEPIVGAAGTIPGKTLETPGALVASFNPDEPQFPQDENVNPPPPTTIAAPAQKAETAGLTVETGLEGVDLQSEEEDDEEEVVKDLARWRANARGRVKLGKPPRPFSSDVIPAERASAVWKSLGGARTREDVDAAFLEVAKSANPKSPWGSENPGAHILNRITAHYAPLIRDAIANGVPDLEGLVQAYAESVRKDASPDLRQAARDWFAANATMNTDQLKAILRELAADTYMAGTHIASKGGQVIAAFDSVTTQVDWDTWQPGWAGAAQALSDPGLDAVLSASDLTIQGIESSTINQIGTQLADAIANGSTVSDAASSIQDFLDGDTDRSQMIATTEMAQAMSDASLATYQQNGVDGVEWLQGPNPCDDCQENADAGVIPVGDTFPSGDDSPPAHPRCVCCISPASLPDNSDQGE